MQPLLIRLLTLDPIPTDNNVKAGWVAFGVFVVLILAVALLCRSFVLQMRKVEAADQAGVYGEHPPEGPEGPEGPQGPDGPEGADPLPPTHTSADH